MAVYYAEQVTNAINGLTPAKDVGSVKRYIFNFTIPTGGYAAGSIIVLALIAAGERITDGYWTNTAAGAAATGKIQNYHTTDVSATGLLTDSKYGTLTDMTGATAQTFANTNAKGQGYVSSIDEYVAVLTAAQTMAAGTIIFGRIDVQ